MQLNDLVSNVKGVGEKTVPKLNNLGINTIGDLIYDLPRGFMDINPPVTGLNEHVGELIAIKGNIIKSSIYTIKKGRQLTFAKVSLTESPSEVVNLIYYNAPYMAKTLKEMDERIFYGVLSDNRGMTLSQPRVYTIEEYDHMLKVLQPIYGLTKGISNNQLSKYIRNAFDIVTLPGEYLNEDELTRYDMPHFMKALMDIHFPVSVEDHTKARRRLVFHEFLTFFLETHTEDVYSKLPFYQMMIPVADTGRLIEALPYRLTDAQLRTWNEIETDMCSGNCMNRMVQGDVGSGKTIIAILALLLNAVNGHQGALMAPTEVLASQHYDSLLELIDKYKLPLVPRLLIGSCTAKEKRQIKEDIACGYANVVIGTHAIIQDDLDYKNLTLAITDEQHRFGVKQREALAKYGDEVHVLVMSATPIPRSLAMTMFSGVSMSIIDELPANRLPIKNCVIKGNSRPTAYKFIAGEVEKGHQVYVICPLVEDSEGINLENVIDYADKLKECLPPGIRVDYLHGKMKATAKNHIMNEFAAHNIDVLVSTTVIEVGINVPNATVMLVENADRFGLASLHQLRGRVGRGDAQSYCIFINTGKSESSKKRLDILNHSNNGFYIADEDLKLRGPGEMSGIRQSGDFGFQIANIYDDYNMLEEVKKFSEFLFDSKNDRRLKEISEGIEEFGFNPVDFKTI